MAMFQCAASFETNGNHYGGTLYVKAKNEIQGIGLRISMVSNWI